MAFLNIIRILFKNYMLINILHKYELLYVNQISIKLVDELINL
jgi:hypothetical protein